MPSRTLTPGSTANLDGVWLNPNNILVQDGVVTQQLQMSPPGRLAALSMTDRNLPAGFDIVGFEITVVGDTHSHPWAVPDDGVIEVALTKDGGFARSATVANVVNGPGAVVVGSPTDLWGEAWSLSDVASSGFGVVVQRPSSYPTGWRFLDAVWVKVYYVVSGPSLMANRPTDLQRCLLGKEVTPGSAVSPTIELHSTKFTFAPDVRVKKITQAGSLVMGGAVMQGKMANLSMEGHPDYNELGYVFASVFGKPSTSNPAVGVYRHEFNVDPKGKSDLQTYTIEYGDLSNAERVTYGVLASLGLVMNRQDTNLSGSGFSRQIAYQAGVTAGSNCVQTLTITGTPTGGTYRLRWKGQRTAAINYNANAAAIQSALEALSNIGSGNVAVSGSGPFTVTFQGTLAGQRQELLELDTNSMTGGTSPSLTIAMTTPGGQTVLSKVPMSVRDISVFYADSLANLAAGKLGDCYEVGWNIANRASARMILDDATDTFKDHVERALDWTVDIDIEANSAANTIEGDVAGPLRYIRVLSTSDLEVVTGTKYSLQMDVAVKMTGVGGYNDTEGDYARKLMADVVFDPAWGRCAQIVLINGVASY